jgi:hypothetical protein
MTGIYWYISRTKVEALRDAYASSGFDWLKDLSFKLNSPFAEASAALRLDQSLYRTVDRLANNLLTAPETRSFPNLSDVGPVTFFSFAGSGQRYIDADAFWVALLADETALLLAGSIVNAIGGSTKIPENAISPSVDPIGAVKLAFKEERLPEESQTVGATCAYVWQTISDPVRDTWQTLPQVEGIAVYGGMFPANIARSSDDSSRAIRKIVIGSPIYVRQK